MKVLKRLLNWTIWSLVALHIAALVVVQVPAAQRWLGAKVSSALSAQTGVHATVGRVGLGLFNRLIVDDVTIPDLQGDTLLRAGRLSVKAALLPLLDGRMAISSAQLFGADIRLRQANADAPLNCQFLIDALTADADTTQSKPLDVRIGSLIVRRSRVSYRRDDVDATPGRFNAADVCLSGISAHIAMRSLTDDSLSLHVRRLSLHEQSGLTVADFTARIAATRTAAHVRDLQLSLPHSTIDADTIDAAYATKETLHYRAILGESTLTAADLAPLLPPDTETLRPAALTALPTLHLSATVSGTAQSLDCQRLRLTASDGSLSLLASGHIDAATPSPDWHLSLDQLDAAPALLPVLRAALPSVPDELSRLGSLSLTGTAARQRDGQANGQATVATALGEARLLFAMDAQGHFDGHIVTDSLHLGQLLGNDDLGHTAATVSFSGDKDLVEADATVQHLSFRSHDYHNIAATATCQPQRRSLTANVSIDDDALKASSQIALTAPTQHTEAATAGKQEPPALKAVTHIARLCPSALALTDKWGDAIFAATADADIAGTNLADAHGRVSIDGFTMRSPADSLLCHIDHLHVSSAIDGGQRLITLSSDIADGRLQGRFDFASPPKDFTLRLAVKDTRWLLPLTGIPLTLDQRLLLTATTDSTAGNRVDASLAWGGAHNADGQQRGTTEGVLNAVVQLSSDGERHTGAHVSVKPSHVMLDGTPWHIHPSSLTYHDGRLQVDSFKISNGSLHVIIDGTASASPADTLTADLDGIDIAYVQDMLDFHPVDFAGQLKGKAKGTAIMGNFSAWADITVPDFRFMDGRMGTLTAHTRWNEAAGGQIDIDATAHEADKDGDGGTTFIKGYVSPVRSDIGLNIRAEGTNIEFCHSFTNSFLKDISGKAQGTVRLEGPLGDMNLTGMLTVDGQMTVAALNTTYRLEDDTLLFVPNDIQLRNVAVADRDGNTAILSGGIHHQWLSDFTFDIGVATHNTLVYDFPTFDDSNICGTVRATGNADIHVRPGEVTINCDVTPQPGSFFAYNAANPDAVSQQDFIKWGTKATTTGEGTHPTEANTATAHADSQPADEPTGDLRINFLINATPDATLRLLMDQNTGDYITLNGEGTIRATFHNKGPFQMFGTYNVQRGNYGITVQNIIKKNFTFQDQGTIVFGGDPYDAALNLQAVHTVNGVSLSDLNMGANFASNTVRVNCLMNIGGTPSQPRVDFDLEMPTVNSEENQMIRSLIASKQEMNQQVLYLLGIGRFYTQGANNADAQQYGQTTLAMQSFLSGTVSTQINEVLSQVIKSNDWNFGANISTGDEGWNNAEYEGMVSGRLLNNRLLVNGQFGYRDKATQATPSFIGDFDMQYLLKRNGNIAVKVYNQTNDRYFTRSSLNTQGVGLVMKKDFDGLGELLRKKKRKTNSKQATSANE